MTRDQLECAVWHGLRDLGLDRSQKAPSVVDTIIKAADSYAVSRIDQINRHPRSPEAAAARVRAREAAL